MQNRGFQWFVAIVGGLILIFSAVAAYSLKDESTGKLLPIFAILYVLYLILFIRSERNRKKAGGKPEKKSPLSR